MKILNLRKKGGFTLIELMVVIVILGGLMTVLFVSLKDNTKSANAGKNKIQMSTTYLSLQTHLDQFRSTVGRFPNQDEGLDALVKQPAGVSSWGGPYLSKLPADPWGNPYKYIVEGTKYKIMSLGADAREGGTGEDADIDLATMVE